MCGPGQLFFQLGPEMPKAWTPLVSSVMEQKPCIESLHQLCAIEILFEVLQTNKLGEEERRERRHEGQSAILNGIRH